MAVPVEVIEAGVIESGEDERNAQLIDENESQSQ